MINSSVEAKFLCVCVYVFFLLFMFLLSSTLKKKREKKKSTIVDLKFTFVLAKKVQPNLWNMCSKFPYDLY
jgi:hypothetical protein